MIIFQVRKQFYEENQKIAAGKYKNVSDWDSFDPVKCMGEDDQLTYYNECIRISTVSSLQEMLLPGLLAVFSPAIVGFILGAEALAGLLGGGLTSGFMLAVMMSNAGGAWDNAKKYVEKDGLGVGKGKNSSYHKATVVGDTVGDPFKDTSGPALNILIKLMSIVSLVLAPVFKECCQEGFSGPGMAAGFIILVVSSIVCLLLQRMMDASNAKWKAEIEAEAAKVKGQKAPEQKEAVAAAAIQPVLTKAPETQAAAATDAPAATAE